jgi:hypothetical protein
VLTALENRLLAYLDNERQAIALAVHCPLSPDATDSEIGDFVCSVLADALLEANGRTSVLVEYLGGQRRDTLRDK